MSRSPRQVAVIAVRHNTNEPEVCLIRRKNTAKWGVPKGFIDPGDTPEDAALTEAIEEAGLRDEILGRAIGTYQYEKRGQPLTVAVYLMAVTDIQKHWSEMAFRERSWFPLEEAAQHLKRHPVAALWPAVKQHIG